VRKNSLYDDFQLQRFRLDFEAIFCNIMQYRFEIRAEEYVDICQSFHRYSEIVIVKKRVVSKRRVD
jgi:hypothetical protein